MYRCNECKCKFGQAKEINAEEFYGVSDLFDYSCGEKIKVCPNCESSDIAMEDEEDEED